jgi:hypothetical protein
MDMKTTQMLYTAGAIAIFVLLVAGALFAYRTLATPMTAFANAEYGISFDYPSSYELREVHTVDRHTIVLADKAALAAAPQNGEGPTTITFDIFANPVGISPEEWVRTNSSSNFQLGTGQMATTSQGGAESVAYVWDGLYRGQSFVFENGTDIVMASVTMLTVDDQITKDFEKILRTLELKK